MDKDLFDDVVSKNVDTSLEQTFSDGSPVVSSGVSGGSKGSHQSTEPSPIFAGGQKCPTCGRVLKTRKGFENHTFLHNVASANEKKPDLYFVWPCVGTLVIQILDEILSEPRIPEEKKKLVEGLKESDGSDNFVHFCIAISTPITNALLEKKKILPTSQYEEVLSHVNVFLCSEDNIKDLVVHTNLLLTDEVLMDSRFIKNVLFRLVTRLCEEIQILVVKEMKKEKSVVTCSETFANPEEKLAFEMHIQSLLLSYYKRASTVNTPVFNARCLCLKHKFVSCGDSDFVTSEMILNNTMWKDKLLKVSETALEFFSEIEGLIKKSLVEAGHVSIDLVSVIVGQSHDSGLISAWHRLTVGFFSEADSLIFLKEIVDIMVDLSVKLEAHRLKRVEEDKKIMQKFGVRTSLKRN